MKKRIPNLVAGCVLMALPCVAQESTSAALFHCYVDAGCPAIGSERETQAAAAAATEKPSALRDWQWWTQWGIKGLAGALDAESTVACRRADPRNCLEANPIYGDGSSRGRLHDVIQGTIALEQLVTALVWRKNPTYGRVLGWASVGWRAPHFYAAKNNWALADDLRRQRERLQAVCPANGAGCSP